MDHYWLKDYFVLSSGELVFARWILDAVRSNFQQGDVRDSRKCCKCGELGHVSRECPTTVKVRCRWAVKDTSRKIALGLRGRQLRLGRCCSFGDDRRWCEPRWSEFGVAGENMEVV